MKTFISRYRSIRNTRISNKSYHWLGKWALFCQSSWNLKKIEKFIIKKRFLNLVWMKLGRFSSPIRNYDNRNTIENRLSYERKIWKIWKVWLFDSKPTGNKQMNTCRTTKMCLGSNSFALKSTFKFHIWYVEIWTLEFCK